MDVATLVGVAIQACSLGLGSTQEDALYLLRRPGQLARSLLAMNVLMPAVAAGLAAAFNFDRAVNVALVALAVSPVPPILPKREFNAGGRASYAVGLLVVAASLAIGLLGRPASESGRLRHGDGCHARCSCANVAFALCER